MSSGKFLMTRDFMIYWIKCGQINDRTEILNLEILDNIRGEERFKKLMERVNVEWENFSV